MNHRFKVNYLYPKKMHADLFPVRCINSCAGINWPMCAIRLFDQAPKRVVASTLGLLQGYKEDFDPSQTDAARHDNWQMTLMSGSEQAN